MKKLFFAIMLLFGMGTMVYANDTYVVTVTVKCEYVYYGENGGLLGRQSTVDQSQTFTICAASEGAARLFINVVGCVKTKVMDNIKEKLRMVAKPVVNI